MISKKLKEKALKAAKKAYISVIKKAQLKSDMSPNISQVTKKLQFKYPNLFNILQGERYFLEKARKEWKILLEEDQTLAKSLSLYETKKLWKALKYKDASSNSSLSKVANYFSKKLS